MGASWPSFGPAVKAPAQQLWAVRPQPSSMQACVGTKPGTERPEPVRMVHLDQMRDLMRGDVVQHRQAARGSASRKTSGCPADEQLTHQLRSGIAKCDLSVSGLPSALPAWCAHGQRPSRSRAMAYFQSRTSIARSLRVRLRARARIISAIDLAQIVRAPGKDAALSLPLHRQIMPPKPQGSVAIMRPTAVTWMRSAALARLKQSHAPLGSRRAGIGTAQA